MSKRILKISAAFTVTVITTILTGCVVIINNDKPSPDEQTLVNIQNSAGKEVNQVNQQIQSGSYSNAQIQQLITQAKIAMDQDLQKLQNLKLPDRAKALADKTKEYLQTAEQTYQSFLQMAASGPSQLQQLENNLSTMTQPLLNMATQLSDTENSFLKQFQNYTSQQ